jgi:hypothetical protein
MKKLLIFSSVLLLFQIPSPDLKFFILKKELERFGFYVLIEPPPKRGAYGLYKRIREKNLD